MESILETKATTLLQFIHRESIPGFISGDGLPVLPTLGFEGESPESR
jgi:hypothetical protein